MSQNKTLPFSLQLAAGGIAGVSEICTMYPLDSIRISLHIVVKTRMQLQKGSGQYDSMFGSFKYIYKTEGYCSLILPLE